MHELQQTISPGLVQVVRLDQVIEGVVALVGQVAAAARDRGCPALLRRHLQHLPAVRACNDEVAVQKGCRVAQVYDVVVRRRYAADLLHGTKAIQQGLGFRV